MAVAFDEAIRHQKAHAVDVCGGRGPAHAVLQALLRIAWAPRSAAVWQDHCGTKLDLSVDCPATVARLVRQG
eukprot:2556370-Alexandrium_andersonii.AAC.1